MKNLFTYFSRRKAAKAKHVEAFIERGRAAIAREYRGLFYDADGNCFGAMTCKGCMSGSPPQAPRFQSGKGIIKDAMRSGFIPLDKGGCLVFKYVVTYTVKEL